MAVGRSAGTGCLFALWTLVSAVGQTTASEIHAPEPSQGESGRSLTNGRNPYAAAFGEFDGNAPGAVSGAEPVPSLAQQVSPPPSAGEKGQLAQRFIDDRLAVWRQRLKLEGWRISVALTRRNDLKPKTLGGIRWDKGKKSAVIWVLDPSDYRLPFREMLDDMELTIVHELVHLQLASLPRSEASRSSEEHAVNGIAEALLKLDRQKVAVPSNTP